MFYKCVYKLPFKFILTLCTHVFQMAAAEKSCDDVRESWSNYLASVNNRVREEDYAQWQAESFALCQRYTAMRGPPPSAAPADDQQFPVPRPPTNLQNPYMVPTRGQQQSQMPLQYVPQQGQQGQQVPMQPQMQPQMQPPFLGFGGPQPGSFMGMLADVVPVQSRVSCDIT